MFAKWAHINSFWPSAAFISSFTSTSTRTRKFRRCLKMDRVLVRKLPPAQMTRAEDNSPFRLQMSRFQQIDRDRTKMGDLRLTYSESASYVFTVPPIV